MPLDLWLAFVVASAVLLVIPGPTVMLVVGHALGRGRSSAWTTVPGVALGDLTAMTVSLAGAGAVLAASAVLFSALKLAGAAYLVWLGVKLWRAAPASFAVGPARERAMFWHAYVVTALNPKSIVFFIAFVPQFVAPERPLPAQFAILLATFVVLAAVNAAAWVVLAGSLRAGLRGAAAMRAVNRVGGGFLVGAGVLAAAAGRTS